MPPPHTHTYTLHPNGTEGDLPVPHHTAHSAQALDSGSHIRQASHGLHLCTLVPWISSEGRNPDVGFFGSVLEPSAKSCSEAGLYSLNLTITTVPAPCSIHPGAALPVDSALTLSQSLI